MCPVKTENMALNVPRAEADFWRRLAAGMSVRSRSTLQKNLLLLALEKVNEVAAKELRSIREEHLGKPLRPVIAMALLLIFCGTMFSHENLLRPGRRVRETEISISL
jgi:hypothetical protein